MPEVIISPKDNVSVVATRHDMVEIAGNMVTGFSGHSEPSKTSRRPIYVSKLANTFNSPEQQNN